MRGSLRVRSLATGVALVAVVSACTDGGSDAADEARAGPQVAEHVPGLDTDDRGPATVQPRPMRARGDVRGWRAVTCNDLRRGLEALTVVAQLPPEVYESSTWRNTCSFAIDIDHSWSVVVGPRESLADLARTQVEPGLGGEGDGAITSASYDGDARVFGRPGGEILRAHEYNDGLPIEVSWFQNRGVRVVVTVPEKATDARRDEASRVVRTVAVRRGSLGFCPGPRTAVRHAVPAQTTDAESYGLGDTFRPTYCHFYLRPLREDLHRHAEVTPDPARTLDQRAQALRERGRARSVHLERDATLLAGLPADRLTWTVRTETRHRRPGHLWRIVTVGNERVAVTWGATVQQWRHEADDYEALLRSVRIN